MLNYPIKFTPILKEKIWGGNKLRDVLNKKSKQENIGESWEISGVEGDISVVANGPLRGYSLKELISEYKEQLMGKSVYASFNSDFPLLIKFIDAQTALSVQVHPGDELAAERHNSFGKTEMWYIVQADEMAEIIVGFKKTIDREEYLQKLEAGEITKLLNVEKVQKGDAFFINTGKVHAIGAGVLLAEIQQTSDITYRIYDWDRVDASGKHRELHTDMALDALDFEQKSDFKLEYPRNRNRSGNIAGCEYFTTNFLPVSGEIQKNYTGLDSFIIYMCVEGAAEIEVDGNTEKFEKGQTVLIPAVNGQVRINSQAAELLEIYIE